ncbi:uncharacterized protein LOC127728828 [Mytilus californianus]|uniref:uncharacterized protein LOC127728828 n=1 Tax=Mytilus californianus TaxID=6549 RepID=UPI0022482E73|nr:uncharacterized protein LOC127728828 [Mytilus californianus]
MKFKLSAKKRQQKDVFQLTCADTKKLSKTSLRYAGILLEFKPKKKPFSALVGLGEDKNIMWNKDLKWNEIYGNGLLASGMPTNSQRGYGKLNLVIPNDKCYNQYGIVRCKIYSYTEEKNKKKVYRQVYKDMSLPSNVDCDESSPFVANITGPEITPTNKKEDSDDIIIYIFLSVVLLALVAGGVLTWHMRKTKQKKNEAKKEAEVEIGTAKKRQSAKKRAKKPGPNKKPL